MEYSDDKTNKDGIVQAVEPEQKSSVNGDADGIIAPCETAAQTVVAPTDTDKKTPHGDTIGEPAVEKPQKGGSFTGELVGVAIKAIAVALSIVLMLTCILAVAMPLSAMRVFNSLGMNARAVDFGERYIARELKSYTGFYEYTDDDNNVRTGKATAAHTDSMGNYDILGMTPALTNDEFMEALYVCINLSYDMMENYYADGDMKMGMYYAERVEKYTRMYLSLNGISLVNANKSEANIASMPMIALRPYVYSYGNDMRKLNFRARVYLAKTENAMSATSGVMRLMTLNSSFWGLDLPSDKHSIASVLDNYVDYISFISEYLDVEFLRAGVENDLGKIGKAGDRNDVPVLSEGYVLANYSGKLSGDGFSLLVTRADGFTPYYEFLKARLHDYFQAAVDYTPDDSNNNKLDEQLHQLYWLQAMSDLARKMWYTGMLLYFSMNSYGASYSAIKEEYTNSVFQGFQFVDYGGRQISIWDIYDIKLAEYVSQYQNN